MSTGPIDASTVVLAIETSCDETAAAVVMGGNDVLSSVVSSQIDVHARFGGVVPEVASRAHLETVVPVVRRAVAESGIDAARIDAVAATAGPGLIGALLVGVSAAKGLAIAWGRPFIGVNHLEAHMYAGLLDHPGLPLPAVVLLVSGGHTMLVHMRGPGDHAILGRTVDDAAGEAYDKVARWLGLGYPGGPAIDRLSAEGDPGAVSFPRAMMHDGLDFSFSGLKTAVVNHVRRNPGMSNADVAASFQAAVVDVLCTKTLRAAAETGVQAVVLGGGVAANSLLRSEMTRRGGEAGLTVALPSREMCTDNAAMIGAAAWHRLAADGPMGLDCGAWPNLRLNDVPRGTPGTRT
ncbi:MAG: tRNA (adenosine(37)-N6)-threonylcarbamoyltransferase complex transferase subunit TsaD [Acidimicrobiales bacterium]